MPNGTTISNPLWDLYISYTMWEQTPETYWAYPFIQTLPSGTIVQQMDLCGKCQTATDAGGCKCPAGAPAGCPTGCGVDDYQIRCPCPSPPTPPNGAGCGNGGLRPTGLCPLSHVWCLLWGCLQVQQAQGGLC